MSAISFNSSFLNDLPQVAYLPWLMGAFLLLNILVIFMLAVAVKHDAEMRNNRGELFLVGSWMWFFVVLLTGGYLPTLAYWLIHYSSLRGREIR